MELPGSALLRLQAEEGVTPFYEWREAPPGAFAVIGDPVHHSLSPQMQSAAFAAMSLAHTYQAVRVVQGEVAAALNKLANLGYAGVNVTVPHKAEARAAMRDVDAFAERCNSVNTIRLRDSFGINTDGAGFIDTLDGLVPRNCDVLLLGAGGSARAIALALAQEGYNLRIYNRTASRAHDLVRDLDIRAEVVDNPSPLDARLIVNATSASLTQESLPIKFDRAVSGCVAYDLVYGETPFLRTAHEAGLTTIDGKRLLVAQGARSIEFWLGIPAPRDVMLESIS